MVSGRERGDRKSRNRSPGIVRSSGRVVKVKFECLGVAPGKKRAIPNLVLIKGSRSSPDRNFHHRKYFRTGIEAS